MISIDKLSSQSAEAASLKMNFPSNVKNTRPFLSTPFLTKKLADSVAVIHQYEEKTKYTYLLDLTVAKQLPSNEFQVKKLFVACSANNQIRFSLVDEQSENPWVRSLVEALHVAQEKPVQMQVDHDAKVYTFESIEDPERFDIDEQFVDDQLKATFDGDYYIESLDHPLIQKILSKRDKSIVAVDEVNSDKTDAEHLQKAEVVDSSALDASNRLDFQEIEREIENPSIPELDLDTLELDDMFA